MGKKYEIEDSEAIVNLCLYCTKSNCRGMCDEFKKAKEEIIRREKERKIK